MKYKGKPFKLPFAPLGFVESKIGTLAVFDLSAGDNSKVREQVGYNVASSSLQEFLRALIPYIVHRVDALGDDNKKPDSPTLTEHDLNELTPQQIDDLLEHFINHQGYLYRKPELKTTTDESGKPAFLAGGGEIVHPRNEGESNAEYLHRLYILREERERAEAERMMSTVIGGAHFSKDLSASIASTLSMGDSISNAIKALKLPPIDVSTLKSLRGVEDTRLHAKLKPIPNAPQIDYEEIERNRRAPFEELGTRLDTLVEINQESLSFAVKSNEVQTGMASEIKSSGEETTRIGKASLETADKGLWWSRFVAFLSAVGLLISAGSLWPSDDGTPIVTELKNGRETQTRQNDQIVAALSDLIELQSQQQTTDRETIEELKQQVTTLQNQIQTITTANNNENKKAEE